MSEAPTTGDTLTGDVGPVADLPFAPVQLQVRRARVSDAADIARIMGHADVYPQTLQMPYADEEAWRTRLTDTLAPGKTDLVLVGEISLNGGAPHVQGMAGLHPAGAQLRRRHVMSLGIAVHPDGQGMGLGWALLAALLDYADRWAQVLRIELHVYADNERAIRLYKSLGFEVEGCLRGDSLRDGEYVDTLCMARWHPSPARTPVRQIEA
ncbi:MAG: GNAT family N-acetyltransferase [Rhodoferax sp.]|jgi:putative acetyltransferase|nr:GNAT family N-acetyltransferase [Rhodoferax sp.]